MSTKSWALKSFDSGGGLKKSTYFSRDTWLQVVLAEIFFSVEEKKSDFSEA